MRNTTSMMLQFFDMSSIKELYDAANCGESGIKLITGDLNIGAISMAPNVLEHIENGEFDTQGLITEVVPVLVVPIILFIIFLIANCVSCCCFRKPGGKTFSKFKSYIFYGVLALFSVAMIIVSILGMSYSFSTGGALECSLLTFAHDLTDGYAGDETYPPFIGINPVMEQLNKIKDETNSTAMDALADELNPIFDELTDPVTGKLRLIENALDTLEGHFTGGNTLVQRVKDSSLPIPTMKAQVAKTQEDEHTLIWIAEEYAAGLEPLANVVRGDIGGQLNDIMKVVRETITDPSNLQSIHNMIDDANNSVGSIESEIVTVYNDIDDADAFSYVDLASTVMAAISALGFVALLVGLVMIGLLSWSGRKHSQEHGIDSFGMFALNKSGKGTIRSRSACFIFCFITVILMLLCIVLFPVTFAFGAVCKVIVEPEGGDIMNTINRFEMFEEGSDELDILHTCLGVDGSGDILKVLDLDKDINEIREASDLSKKIVSFDKSVFDAVPTATQLRGYYASPVITTVASFKLNVNLVDTASVTSAGNIPTVKITNPAGQEVIFTSYAEYCKVGGAHENDAFCKDATVKLLASEATQFIKNNSEEIITQAQTYSDDTGAAFDGFKGKVLGSSTEEAIGARISEIVTSKLQDIFGYIDVILNGINCRVIGKALDTFSDGVCVGTIGNMMNAVVCWIITACLSACFHFLFIYFKKTFRKDASLDDASNPQATPDVHAPVAAYPAAVAKPVAVPQVAVPPPAMVYQQQPQHYPAPQVQY